MNLSRRDTLLGTAALAAAPLITSTQVKAAAPVADKQAPSFYRYKVGDAVVTVISDGKNVFPLTDCLHHQRQEGGRCCRAREERSCRRA